MPLGHLRDLPTLRAQCRVFYVCVLLPICIATAYYHSFYHCLLPFTILRTLMGCGEHFSGA